jgi:hypothetical protein
MADSESANEELVALFADHVCEEHESKPLRRIGKESTER